MELGFDATPAKVEGLRSKARRLAERGWLLLEASGAFSAVRRTVAVPDAGLSGDHRPPDHRLAGGGQGLVVPGQTAGVHQPRERRSATHSLGSTTNPAMSSVHLTIFKVKASLPRHQPTRGPV